MSGKNPPPASFLNELPCWRRCPVTSTSSADERGRSIFLEDLLILHIIVVLVHSQSEEQFDVSLPFSPGLQILQLICHVKSS